MVLPLIALEDHESLGKGPPKRSECFLLVSTCLRQVPGHMHRALEIQCLGSFKLCSWVTTHLILGRQRWSKHLLIQPKMSVAHGQYLELQRHGPDLISMSNTQTKKNDLSLFYWFYFSRNQAFVLVVGGFWGGPTVYICKGLRWSSSEGTPPSNCQANTLDALAVFLKRLPKRIQLISLPQGEALWTESLAFGIFKLMANWARLGKSDSGFTNLGMFV